MREFKCNITCVNAGSRSRDDGTQGVRDRGEDAWAAGVASGEHGPEARPAGVLRVLLRGGRVPGPAHHRAVQTQDPHVARYAHTSTYTYVI